MTHGSASDTGAADPRLASALAAGDRAEALAALVGARVFAAITATATAEQVIGGLRAESSAEMAVVLIEAPDGSRALPVFQDLAALKRWRLDARPVPLTGPQACAAALDEGAVVVLLDPAGAALAVTELRTLAQGWVPIGADLRDADPPAGGSLARGSLASRRGATALTESAVPAPPELVLALGKALTGERLRSARLLEGPDGAVLGVAARRELPPQELAALAHRLVQRLGPQLPAEGLDLAQVPATGPGQEVLRRRWFSR